MSYKSTTNARTFYINPLEGSDKNTGLSPKEAWKTLEKASKFHLESPFQPGDSILLKAGETFKEAITFKKLNGTEQSPITIDWYEELTPCDKKLNRPIIVPPPDKQQQCLIFKDCSFIHIKNLEIQRGKIYSVFGKVNDKQYEQQKVFETFLFENIYMHNIYIGDPARASIEFNVLNACVKVKKIKIKNCEFENITCQAISFNASKMLYRALNLKDTFQFEQIEVLNNKIKNISATAICLNYSTNSCIENNKIENSGKFLYDKQYNKKGSSGINIINCSKIAILKNQIQGSFGDVRSSAIHIGCYNTNIQIRYNFCKDNSGGFLMVMGGCSKIECCFNISFNDGLRIKQTNTNESTNGRIISLSDFSGWCGIQNENKYDVNFDINLSYNIFCNNIAINPTGISFFGRNESIEIDNNYIITKSKRNFEIMANNLVKKIFFTNNKLSGKVQVEKVREANLDIVNNNLTVLLNEEHSVLFEENTNYSNCIAFLLILLKNHNLLHEITNISQLFEKSQSLSLNVTQKIKKPKLYCIICYAPRKHLCLMQYLAANKSTLAFLNDELAIDFQTSVWEVASWFSTPSQLLSNKKAREILKITETFSEANALEALFSYCATKVTTDKILLLGEHFALSGSSMFNFLCEEMNELIEINLLMFFDNIYKDIEFKLTKRYEQAQLNEIKNLDVNSYVSHISCNAFLQLQALISSVQSHLGEEHFFAVDFQYSEKVKNFKELWKCFSNMTECPVPFKPLFDELSKCTKNLRIFDEECIDSLFFNYLFQKHKEKNIEEQKIELEEIKKFQTKYQISSNHHPLLTLSNESIELCEKHRTCMEALCNFKYFGNTIFIDNGFENSAKRIKTNYYEINSLVQT